jgi:hypothetical protein
MDLRRLAGRALSSALTAFPNPLLQPRRRTGPGGLEEARSIPWHRLCGRRETRRLSRRAQTSAPAIIAPPIGL